ncbi:MAG: ABC transporter ATP-binding protein [Chloroflexi bacterium]|nr:ABC transporter ATP-binding protein [Chloroflexota bacterium]
MTDDYPIDANPNLDHFAAGIPLSRPTTAAGDWDASVAAVDARYPAVIPQLIGWIVDRGIEGGDRAFLGYAVLVLVGLALARAIMNFFQGVWVEEASQGVAYDLRKEIHRKLTHLSFDYHDKTEAGQHLSRALRDVEWMRFLTGRATLRLVEGSVLLVGTAIFLLTINVQLALMALLVMPVLIWRSAYFSARIRPISRKEQDQLGVLTTRLEQNLRGARVIKSFAQENAELERFDEQNRHWFDLAMQASKLRAVNAPLMILIANLSTVIIILAGGVLVVRDQMTIGQLVAFLTYMGQLAEPARLLGLIAPVLGMAAASGERIFEILDARSEVQEVPEAADLPRVEGHVRFENVSFSYFSGYTVLHNISLEVQPGQVVALLGKTGSGKSTITNLIPRFYDPDSGCIRIDGQDISQVSLTSLRDQIGIVLQETVLFAATVRENIIFGRPEASEDEMIAAAKAAQAHDFIVHDLPHGYDTEVGERGVTLSGGQKQRIAIARALLKDPRILILDDATSSVDTETERLIQIALDNLIQNYTAFIIAQRLSTVRKADLILVLDKGQIATSGTHEELLARSGLYAEIYHQQLKPQEAAIDQIAQGNMGGGQQ